MKPATLKASVRTVDEATASLRRRLRFAGKVHCALDGIASAAQLNRVLRLGSYPLQNLPIQLAKVVFDLIESVRSLRPVPRIGNPEKAVHTGSGRVLQHPRYRTYWYDRSAHTLVGMHLGLDVIRHGGRYYILENNLGAGLGPERRKLYGEVDPLHENLVKVAKSGGFARLVVMGRTWARHNVDGFEQAGRRHGVIVVPMSLSAHSPRAAHAMVAMPAQLERKTLYVFHSGRATSLGHYVHNKWSSGKWLAHALPATGAKLTVPVPSHDEPTLPDVDPGSQWPNLVVKLASADKGKAVLLYRFDSVDEARRVLGVKRPGDLPVPFRRRGLVHQARRILYGADQPIYQPFIPPPIDDAGHTQTIRIHIFVSPLTNAYLSTTVRVATRPVPKFVAPGIVEDLGPFVGSDSAGYSVRQPIDQSGVSESELRVVTEEFGAALRDAVSANFDIGEA